MSHIKFYEWDIIWKSKILMQNVAYVSTQSLHLDKQILDDIKNASGNKVVLIYIMGIK